VLHESACCSRRRDGAISGQQLLFIEGYVAGKTQEVSHRPFENALKAEKLLDRERRVKLLVGGVA